MLLSSAGFQNSSDSFVATPASRVGHLASLKRPITLSRAIRRERHPRYAPQCPHPPPPCWNCACTYTAPCRAFLWYAAPALSGSGARLPRHDARLCLAPSSSTVDRRVIRRQTASALIRAPSSAALHHTINCQCRANTLFLPRSFCSRPVDRDIHLARELVGKASPLPLRDFNLRAAPRTSRYPLSQDLALYIHTRLHTLVRRFTC